MLNNLAFLYKLIELFNYLQKSILVAKFQKYFGVHRIDNYANGDCTSNNCHVKTPVSSKYKVITVKYSSINPVKENGIKHRISLHNKIENEKNCSSDYEEINSETDSDQENEVQCRIESKFWYYFFSFGASLGYEMFYASFFPFWIWNIDGAVCRRVIIVWVVVMYVGQALKDIICWPRPSAPPVIHLEPRYVQEYGMPSTHAMVGAAVPFSCLFFTMHRYEYPFIIGLLIATAWCVLVCCSRLYMGMHTVLDIIGGLILVAILMTFIIPFSDAIDNFQLTNSYSPLIMIGIMIFLQVIYPKTQRWTPARGDTAIIMGTGTGFALGSWLNYKLGIISGPSLPPPYQIIWPDYGVIGLALLRAVIGILCIVATRAIFRSITFGILCFFMGVNRNDMESRQKVIVEIPHKFISYVAIGFVITYLAPCVFRLLSIERITMYTEV